MKMEPNDFSKLSYGISSFLSKAGIKYQLSTIPVLYLEMPDVNGMYELHQIILANMSQAELANGIPFEYVDDQTIKFDLYCGINIVLTCKQRFYDTEGRSIGYRDMNIVNKSW